MQHKVKYPYEERREKKKKQSLLPLELFQPRGNTIEMTFGKL